MRLEIAGMVERLRAGDVRALARAFCGGGWRGRGAGSWLRLAACLREARCGWE